MDLSRYDDGHGDDGGTGESVGGGTHSDSSTENDDVAQSDYAGAEGGSTRIKDGDNFHEENDPNNALPGLGDSSASAAKMAQFRREKRLAMNRESARNRRKRKKMLIETLEQQNSELSRDNRSLKLMKESLAAKVRLLEHELATARTTIAQFQLAAATQLPNQTLPTAGFSAATTSLPQQLAFGGGGFASQLNSLSAAVADQSNTDQSEHARHSATNQLDPFGLQQARSQQNNLQLASVLKNTNPTSQHLSDDPILRRHAADMQALSQASRDSALGSIANPQHLLGDNPLQRSIALQSSFPGIRSEPEQTSVRGFGDVKMIILPHSTKPHIPCTPWSCCSNNSNKTRF